MGAPAYWTREEGESTASATRKARQEEAAVDIRSLAGATKTKHLDVSVLDKWQLFKQWTAANSQGAEMWAPRRLFYTKEGALISGLQIMVSDIVGSALDRGAPAPQLCKLTGSGLTQASVGQVSTSALRPCPCFSSCLLFAFSSSNFDRSPPAQVATFTIIACSSHGIRFEDGGDTFTVNIRFSGLGIRARSKIVDNDDGSYTVSYKPVSAGRCTIRVSLLGEELPGSPFTCVVSGLAGPAPCASMCSVHEALNKVTSRNPGKHTSFRMRSAGWHASDLDVWVQPVVFARRPAQAAWLATKLNPESHLLRKQA